tara:strand:- start:36 stop:446 length:411 start_codon:yes stop_codon:yes gene_type:complete
MEPKETAPSLRFIGTDDYLDFYSDFEQKNDMTKVQRGAFMVAMTVSPILSKCFEDGGEEAARAKAWMIGHNDARFDDIHKRMVNKHNSVKSALMNSGVKKEELTAEKFPLPKKGSRVSASKKDVQDAWARRLKNRK